MMILTSENDYGLVYVLTNSAMPGMVKMYRVFSFSFRLIDKLSYAWHGQNRHDPTS